MHPILFSNVLYTSDTNQATAHVAADLIADHFKALIQYNIINQFVTWVRRIVGKWEHKRDVKCEWS